jgi:hypothetical protein
LYFCGGVLIFIVVEIIWYVIGYIYAQRRSSADPATDAGLKTKSAYSGSAG